MIKAEHAGDGWVRFITAGGAMLRFAACVRSRVRPECFRQRRGEILVANSALPALLACAREFGVDMSKFSGIIDVFARHEKARKYAMEIVLHKNDSGVSAEWDFLEPHQKIAVNALIREGLLGACIFDEQGTGKTLSALAAFDLLKKAGAVDFMMAVAPQTVLNSWQKDAEKIPDFGEIKISMITGGKAEKESAIRVRADIYALSYDSLISMLPVAKATAGRGNCLLVADEAFLIKNPRTQRAAAVRELREKCARAFVLSGTPAPCKPEDIINQSDIADNGFAFQGYRPTGDSLRDADSIYRILASNAVFLRRTKQEVLPMLPPKEFNIVSVSLSGRQQDLYLSARDNLAVYLQNMNNQTFKKELANYFQRRAKLLQLCGCPSMVDGMFSGAHAKIRKLDELVESIVVKNGKKLVIWTSYTDSLKELEKRYRKHGMVLIYGETSEEGRRNAIERFQNDRNIKIFLGNPAAAGAGITLHAAADAVYVSYSDKAAEFIQSIDRIHRIGQTADVVRYHFLVCENTVEINQIRLLRQKMLNQHILLGETSDWPSSVEDALEELGDE